MHPGDIVAGKYRVANILGRTNGYLLEARHTEFEQRVVIRLLSPHLCDKKEIERFRREARTLSKLESEHVARIIDVGTHSDGSFYLVRQYLDGLDLATHLRNQGALPLEDAVLFILQASEAVQECHSHNILLREVQPAHLFLTRRRGGTPMIKITDFGTAKLLRDPMEMVNGEATATVMFGMTAYSSPELVRKNKVVDPRTDVWSLGCIFYEMLAAVPPFQGDAAELMLRITRDDPIPLSQLRPDVPREFDQILTWALAKDSTSRFSSVYAMAHALKGHASPEGQVLIERIGRLAHTQPGDVPPPPQISPTSPLSRRSGPSSAPPPPPSRRQEQTMLIADPGSYDEHEYERARYLGEDPYAPPSYPGSQPPPPLSSRGSIPPPSASHPGGSGSWSALAIDPDPLGSPYSNPASTGGWPAPTALGQQQRTRQRKAAVIAFGASLLLLPALVMVLVVTLRGPNGLPGFTSNDTAPREAPATTSAKEDEPPAEQPSSQPAASAPPATSAADGNTAPFPPPAVARANPQPAPQTGRSPKPVPKPVAEEPLPEDEPEGGGGETGTLVAIAIGGSCAFSVDGASHGTRSSIRVTVPVGPHTVSCSPKGKSSRSQRVNVKPGKPGMATFRLN